MCVCVVNAGHRVHNFSRHSHFGADIGCYLVFGVFLILAKTPKKGYSWGCVLFGAAKPFLGELAKTNCELFCVQHTLIWG